MFVEVIADLRRLIWSWWKCDQIRVSPVEGQLLRVHSGDILTVSGADVEVVERIVATKDGQRTLEIHCRCESGLGVLCVTITPDESIQTVVCIESGHCRQLDPGEIQVWARRQTVK